MHMYSEGWSRRPTRTCGATSAWTATGTRHLCEQASNTGAVSGWLGQTWGMAGTVACRLGQTWNQASSLTVSTPLEWLRQDLAGAGADGGHRVPRWTVVCCPER